MPCSKAGWIPLKCSSLHFGIKVRIRQMNAMADVIEDWFFAPGVPHGFYHTVNEGRNLRWHLPVMWLIAHFKPDDSRVKFISHACVLILVIQKLEKISL